MKSIVFVLALGFAALLPDVSAEPTVLEAAEEKRGTTEGKFAGIDQGDYFYFLVEIGDDQQDSFFILKPDKSVQEFLDHPEKYLGQPVVVHWLEKEMHIPEAGGPQIIKEVLRVERK